MDITKRLSNMFTTVHVYPMPVKQNHTRRRFVKATGAASVVGVTGLAGCSEGDGGDGSDGGDGGDVEPLGSLDEVNSDDLADEIVFYNAGGLQYDPGTEENIKRFEDEFGVSVNVNEVPWNNLKTSLTTIWRNEDSKVDAFNGPTWWLADFQTSNWITPLKLGDDHMSKFPDKLVDLVQFDGETYMAPEFGKWGSFLYDTEVVDTPPDTWDDVLSMDVPDDKSAFGFTWANKDVFTFKQFLYQAGGQLFDDSWNPTFVDKGMDVMNFVVDLRDNGLIPDGLSSMGEGGVGDAFIAGQFATVESWTPLGSRAIEEWGEDRVGSAKPPEGPGGSRATFQDTNGIAVSAFSERQYTARVFAKFMTTTESSKQNMLVEGNPAVVPSVYEDSDVQDQYPSWLLEDMKFNLENAQSETYLAQPQVDDYLSEQITAVLVGDKEPQPALEDAHSNIERLYQDIGLI